MLIEPMRPAHADEVLAIYQGVREVGRRERIGQHRGRWRDVTVVERRSPKIG